MNSRYRWDGLWLAALVGLLGYALFVFLYARYSPAMHTHAELDNAAAIARAQTIAQELGYDVSGAEIRAAGETNLADSTEYYFIRQPQPEFTKLLTPTRINVGFNRYEARENLQFRLTSNGQLARFSTNQSSAKDDNDRPGGGPQRDGQPPNGMPPRDGPPPPSARATAPTPEQTQMAERAFARYLNTTGLFSGAPTISKIRRGFSFAWKKTFPGDDRMALLAEVEVVEQKVAALYLTPEYSQAFELEASQHTESTLESLVKLTSIFFVLLAALLALATFFGAWGRREIMQAPALRLLFGTFLIYLTINLFSGQFESMGMQIGIPRRWAALLVKYLIYSLLMLGLGFIVYLFWAAGIALAGRHQGRRTVAFELLLDGKLNQSYLARQCAIGILLGGLTILPAFLLKATLFQSADFGTDGLSGILGMRLPWIAAFAKIDTLFVFLLFAYVVPLLKSLLMRWSLGPIAATLFGSIIMSDLTHFPHASTAQFLTGILAFLVLYFIYQKHDLLTVMVSYITGLAALQTPALLAQNAPSYHQSGWIIIGLLALGLIVSLVGVARGVELDEKVFEPLNLAPTGVERERLKAELVVATKAQQQMLPAAPPHVPGLEIAASCKPSKDVGGDLYDFLTLPDGRLGIVVADVSGKGVPAALYMTLTKGVLAAITEYESDPGAILREANRHLYEACRKKVFVTLFLGVYDPASRVLTYARAGHNPTVYRSRVKNETQLLKPRGMGLGLAGEKLFNPALAVASLQLATDDLLFFYSDGITEAMNNRQDEYGEERLMEVAVRADGQNAASAHDAVLADVKNFLGTVPPQDDQTLVVLRVCEA